MKESALANISAAAAAQEESWKQKLAMHVADAQAAAEKQLHDIYIYLQSRRDAASTAASEALRRAAEQDEKRAAEHAQKVARALEVTLAKARSSAAAAVNEVANSSSAAITAAKKRLEEVQSNLRERQQAAIAESAANLQNIREQNERLLVAQKQETSQILAASLAMAKSEQAAALKEVTDLSSAAVEATRAQASELSSEAIRDARVSPLRCSWYWPHDFHVPLHL